MPSVRLENWSVTRRSDNPYIAPESCPFCLHGQVYDHPKFNDGDRVTTSVVQAVSQDWKRARSRNTEYILGTIDEEFQRWMEQEDYSLEQFADCIEKQCMMFG
jgi:hypothetical protein